MKTRTIFDALRKAEYDMRSRHLSHRERFYQMNNTEKRKAIQGARFERELLRRLDERDALRAELATARAFISSVVDEPKDYPAEVSA